MSRIKKDAKILNVKLASSVYEELDCFCTESGLSKTVATEKILAYFLIHILISRKQNM